MPSLLNFIFIFSQFPQQHMKHVLVVLFINPMSRWRLGGRVASIVKTFLYRYGIPAWYSIRPKISVAMYSSIKLSYVWQHLNL
jgi:hypothetical protein